MPRATPENPFATFEPFTEADGSARPLFEISPTPRTTATPRPTRRPTASPSPLPTLDPKDYVYASDTVVYQYPAAGTTLYKNESVDLFFYDISNFRLDTLRRYRTVTIPQPSGTGNKSSITLAVYAVPNDTGKKETVYNKTIYTSLFPLSVKIPVSYNGGTNVTIYVNNKLYCEYLSQ